uniref:CTP synthase n=1 Tax=Eufriesea mexicana TaxID=516756 RepID=A0A310S3W6_9HYME
MSPYQKECEVFVTSYGDESHFNLGHCERFTDEDLTRYSNITTRGLYQSLLKKERDGCKSEVIITESSATVDDIELLAFSETIRQVENETGPENANVVNTTLITYLYSVGEIKTKPSQNSIR